MKTNKQKEKLNTEAQSEIKDFNFKPSFQRYIRLRQKKKKKVPEKL